MLLDLELSIMAARRRQQKVRYGGCEGLVEPGTRPGGEDVDERQPELPWMGIQAESRIGAREP